MRTNGGVCDKMAMGFSQMACDTCFSGAQQMGGKCSTQQYFSPGAQNEFRNVP